MSDEVRRRDARARSGGSVRSDRRARQQRRGQHVGPPAARRYIFERMAKTDRHQSDRHLPDVPRGVASPREGGRRLHPQHPVDRLIRQPARRQPLCGFQIWRSGPDRGSDRGIPQYRMFGSPPSVPARSIRRSGHTSSNRPLPNAGPRCYGRRISPISWSGCSTGRVTCTFPTSPSPRGRAFDDHGVSA